MLVSAAKGKRGYDARFSRSNSSELGSLAYKRTPANLPSKADPKDIEDIVDLGKAQNVCPYYATRRSVKQAQVSAYGFNRVCSALTLYSTCSS